ncbi:MAG: hypothetical protein ACHQPH_17680 [Reyranellales bacterium]
MSRHARLIAKLADRLRRREVDRLAYFHTDHFEPWRSIDNAPAIGPESVLAVHDFCRSTERLEYARRLTLFYKPYVGYALRPGTDLLRVEPSDLVGFRPRSEVQARCGREAMSAVATSTCHDIQLHLHHERFTATSRHTDPDLVQWFSGPQGRSLDGSRLELAIRLSREAIAQETDRTDTRWFFVHGQWALNASDERSCTITNEIDILRRNGCAGDFTFPADYAHTNPRIEVPYFCRPVDKAKGYDSPEAEPEVACGNAAAAGEKFFIWSSSAKAGHVSLDYMFEPVRTNLANIDKAAIQLLADAYAGDRTLFIKTHAHSMNAAYFRSGNAPVFPHEYPPARELLSIVFEAATRADVEVKFLTAPEVHDTLVFAATKPEIDLQEPFRGLFSLSYKVRRLINGALGR